MRMVVGPEAPAVYWRRRAVVFGGFLVAVFAIVYACTGSGASGAKKPASATPSGTQGPTAAASSAAPLSDPTQSAAPSPSASPTLATTPLCQDAEIAVVASPVRTSSKVGATLRFDLSVANSSNRACARDIGADQQELLVMQGSRRVWSSDDCAAKPGRDVRILQPGEKLFYYVNWDAQTSQPQCKGQRTAAPAGEYQVIGRFGTKTSAGAAFQLVP